ncbi:MAG: hypothetical protein IPO13_04560 [Rhodocyclaceae bacterium]|nr:hypothetical protein [Rhodocyclaceae bacterium]
MKRLSVFIATALIYLHVTVAFADDVMLAPTENDIAMVKDKWLENHCSAGLNRDQFQLCLRAYVAKMEPLDPSRREQFGEQYDPQKWYACMQERGGNYGFSNCEQFRLRRIENPEYWPYPEVPAMKWPEPPTPSVYEQLKKKYLVVTSEEYFKSLCAEEAGEFVYRTVENVEAIYQIRPRIVEGGNVRQEDRYVIEAPYFHEVWDSAPGGTFTSNLLGYHFFEVSSHQDGRIRYEKSRHYDPSMSPSPLHGEPFSRFFKGDSNKKLSSTKKEHSDQLRSRFGFTWRGINRFEDRKNGIAGGELAVVDLKTAEILAIKRSFNFAKGARTKTGLFWAGSQVCPQDSNDTFRVHEFLTKVLKPTSSNQLPGALE